MLFLILFVIMVVHFYIGNNAEEEHAFFFAMPSYSKPIGPGPLSYCISEKISLQIHCDSEQGPTSSFH
jgi:hypothetical protein